MGPPERADNLGQYGIMLDYPRGSIWAPSHRGAPLAAVIDYVRATTSPDDYVAVIPEERLINFLAERRNQTRDSGIEPAWLATAADERAFVRELEEKRTRTVAVPNGATGNSRLEPCVRTTHASCAG